MTDIRFDGAGPDAAWRELLENGTFALQHCETCARAQFPPTVLCCHCGAPSLVFRPASGHGTVYSTTTVRTREGSYNVSIIELAEGPRMMSRVEGDPNAVRIGQEVEAAILAGETLIVVFHGKARS